MAEQERDDPGPVAGTDVIGSLIDAGDLDELVRTVDRFCAVRDWDGLVELGDRCRRAFDRGRQLWPISDLVAYRLALEAPGPQAASVLVEGSVRFSRGPLTEVAASTHAWSELADHLPSPTAGALVAHERVVRGEDLRGDDRIDPRVLEVPLVLQPWEPAYPVATYRADGADFPRPALPARREVDATPAVVVDDPDATRALREVVRPWLEESNGRADVVAVEGDAAGAVRALGAPVVRLGPLSPAEALAQVAWAGASGGAHGRRRGAALGRFEAWWLVAALGGLVDELPAPPDEIGDLAHALRWYVWDAGEPDLGWSLRLAVEDPDEGLAWALGATDAE